MKKNLFNSQQVLLEVCEDVARRIPLHRWERLRDPMTWTEHINGEDVQFELLVLENTRDQIHISVGIMYSPTSRDGVPLIPNMASVSTDFILKKPPTA